MASQLSSTASKPGPLAFMTSLSPWLSVYRPERAADAAASGPRLVILLTWMNAGPAHIAKYARAYQALYPCAQILLVRSAMKHVIWNPTKATPDIQPAIPIIRAATRPNVKTAQVLIHAWSNGGSAMLSHLRAAYGADFPPHVTILDSAPALYHHSQALAAVTVGMPMPVKLAAYPLLVLISVTYVLWYLGRTNAFSRFALSHNKAQGEVGRAYIYSDVDRLASWQDVEKHAREAEKKGYTVRMEKFHGTQHVSHVRGDEERYWRIIKETWNSSAL